MIYTMGSCSSTPAVSNLNRHRKLSVRIEKDFICPPSKQMTIHEIYSPTFPDVWDNIMRMEWSIGKSDMAYIETTLRKYMKSTVLLDKHIIIIFKLYVWQFNSIYNDGSEGCRIISL